MSNSNVYVEIYKATLEFLGKIFLPIVVLILAVQYKGDLSVALSKLFEDRRISGFETPFGSASFEKISNDLASSDPGSKQEELALRKIETGEEVVKFEMESGARREIPVAAVAADPEIDKVEVDPSWSSVLGISWVKPNDLFGRTYFLDIKNELYIWPVTLDNASKRAMFVINTSAKSRRSGKVISDNVWIGEGKSHEFSYKQKKYRINLVDIRKAGKIPSNAAFVSVDELQDEK